MGALTTIIGVLLAALSAQLAFEFREWTPRWVELLIDRAVRRLPVELQDRMAEEWRDFISGTPGYLAKLKRAAGLKRAALRITADMSGKIEINSWRIACSRATGLVGLVLMAPLLLAITLIVWRGGQLFERESGSYRFRIPESGLKPIIMKSSLDELPSLWNIVTGEVTVSWTGVKSTVLRILTKKQQ